tara:strand:- start:597 stop:836 length:240 start_codon:yes stop_codon:yes gene_type:complete
MRRFGLLGGEPKRPEEPKLEERPIEPSEEEKARAQEMRRQQKMKELFSGIGNKPAPQAAQKKREETDEDVLFSGLKGTY